MDNFKEFVFEYSEVQGNFHYNDDGKKSPFYRPVCRVESIDIYRKINAFCVYMNQYNNKIYDENDNGKYMSYDDVWEALRVFIRTGKIVYTRKSMPEESGVYRLYDEDLNLIHEAKAMCINKRLKEVINNKTDARYFTFCIVDLNELHAGVSEPLYFTTFIDVKKAFKDCEKNERIKPRGTSYTYLMVDNRTGRYKIGKSIKPKLRERTLQSEVPDTDLIGYCSELVISEQELHAIFGYKRYRGEWFNLNANDIVEIKNLMQL